MKNLMTYVNPSKKFGENDRKMVEIQIDNSLDYWKPEDIMLVTNFPFKYNGIKAIVIPDELCCKVNVKTSKIGIIVYLLENRILNELAWVHDLDAFQLAPLDLPPLDRDIGFIDYFYNPLINTGNVFFKPTALDVFKWINEEIHKWNKIDELVLPSMIERNHNNIRSRFRKLNVTYNVGMRQTERLAEFAEKPVKIAHFPPFEKEVLDSFRFLLPPRLTKLLDEKFTNIH